MDDSYTRAYDWDEREDGATVYLARTLPVRLTDPDKNPLPYARCRIVGDSETIYECGDDGIVSIPIKSWNQETIELEWEPKEAQENPDGERFYWKGVFNLNVRSKDEAVCRERLTHLGFAGGTLADQVKAYQERLGRDPTGVLGDIIQELVAWHDGGSQPGQQSAGAASPSFSAEKSEYWRARHDLTEFISGRHHTDDFQVNKFAYNTCGTSMLPTIPTTGGWTS